jgi:CheY-like chemotaxis protein
MTTSPPLNEWAPRHRIRALLERHGMPRHKHSPAVAGLLDLSYSTAHRKLQGASPWTLDELQRLAAHYGEPLAVLLDTAGPQTDVEPSAAILVCGSLRVPCRLWLGARLEQIAPGTLAACMTGGRWAVTPAEECKSGEAFAVAKLVIEPDRDHRRRVAVLDDNRDLAETIAVHLREVGYDAVPYFSVEALMNDFRERAFEGYIIDWVVGKSTARELTHAIRAHDASAPIAVLTGQLEANAGIESEVAAALASDNLLFFEKPVRLPIVSAALTRAFADHPV